MTETLGGLEILTKTTSQQAKLLIQPGENVIGCIRATGERGEDRAFIALDTRLLYIAPLLKKMHSIEYVDIQTIEIEEPNLLESLLRINVLSLEVKTTYSGDAGWTRILVNPRHRQYTMRFAEVIRTKMREARTPTLKVFEQNKQRSSFIDELERLSSLHKQGRLTDEEFDLAKRKLLS